MKSFKKGKRSCARSVARAKAIGEARGLKEAAQIYEEAQHKFVPKGRPPKKKTAKLDAGRRRSPVPASPDAGRRRLQVVALPQQNLLYPSLNFPVAYFSRSSGGPLSAANGDPLSVDSGAQREVAIHTGHGWSDAVLNAVANGQSDVRYPDPFTLVKTFVTSVSTNVWLTSVATSTSCTSTSYDYAVSGAVNGSPVYTYTNQAGANHIQSVATRNDYLLNNSTYWANGGVANTDFYSRPNGVVVRIRVHLVGVAHSVRMCAVPMPPMDIAAWNVQFPAGWQTYVAQGLTAQEISYGGREWQIEADDKGIALVCLPIDSRCLDFMNGGAERNVIADSAHVAWAGWRWWIYGLSVADTVAVTCNYVEEQFNCMHNVSPIYSYPLMPKEANSTLRDQVSNKVVEASNAGLTGYKILDGIVDFATKGYNLYKKISPMLGTFGGLFNPMLAGPSGAYVPSDPHLRGAVRPDRRGLVIIPERETKEDYEIVSSQSSSMSGSTDLSASTLIIADQARALANLKGRLGMKT